MVQILHIFISDCACTQLTFNMIDSPFNPLLQSDNMESKIVVALERISEAFRVLLWQEGKDLGISPIQIQILIFLLFHGDAKRKVSYLAQEFNMSKPTVSDAVKVLERKGFIRKEIQPGDTRSYMMHLTEEGKKVAEKMSLFANPMEKILQGWEETEKSRMLGSLLDLIYQLTQVRLISVPRMCFTCRFYGKDEKGSQHFCHLLSLPLPEPDLRIDCPEHEAAL
jgi:DNA-binding MarR family transcriptional regulator